MTAEAHRPGADPYPGWCTGRCADHFPAEPPLRLYAEGGHAFGLRPTPFPISEWPKVMEKWLHMIKAL